MNQTLSQKIFIPTNCEHTQALRVQVEPQSSKMYIQLCDPETGESFQEGSIEGRRCPEIAIFMFRPMKLIEKDGNVERQTHLIPGDKVLVKVQVYDSKDSKFTKEQLVDVL